MSEKLLHELTFWIWKRIQ